jgi:hypothetical protein
MLDCKLDWDEGDISITTDNVLHYLVLVEAKAIAIVSNYKRLEYIRGSAQKNKMTFGDNNRSSMLSIKPPRLLDYSSEDSVDDGDDADSYALKRVHRQSINYAKIAVRASVIADKPKRKTVTGRQGSIFTGGRASVAFMHEGLRSPE